MTRMLPPLPPEVILREENGIICIEYLPGTRVSAEITRATLEYRKALLMAAGRKKHRLLMIGSRVVSYDYQAYRFSTSKEASETITAAAIVTRSALERHLSSIFINMWHPRYPTRLFENVEAARAWLDTFEDC